MADDSEQLAPWPHLVWWTTRPFQNRTQNTRPTYHGLILKKLYDKFVVKLNWIDEQIVRTITNNSTHSTDSISS